MAKVGSLGSVIQQRVNQQADSQHIVSQQAITKEDERRSRILYRYLRPQSYLEQARLRLPTQVRAPDAPTSPDAMLTALAQLICLRLNIKRAIISVIDVDTTYTLAEGTQSLNLIDTHASDEGDGLYIGCASLSKGDSLCQNVISVDLADNELPLFVVPDLSEDDRFKHMPMVNDAGQFRFYAGTPLVSEHGVSIGAVAAIDTKKRGGLTQDQAEFLVHMSKTIMDSLELKRQADERTRIVRMSQGLNAFIQGESRIMDDKVEISDRNPISSPTFNENSLKERSGNVPSEGIENAKALGNLERSTSQHSESSDFSEHSPGIDERIGSAGERRSVEDEYRRTVSRAAYLLHECLGFGDEGGVVFFENASGISASDNEPQRDDEGTEIDPVFSPNRVAYEPSAEVDTIPSKVLGIAPRHALVTPTSQIRPHSFLRPIPQSALQNIFRRYKRGKLWTFDIEFGIVSSDEDDPMAAGRRASISAERGSKRRRAEADLLQTCFPGARNIIFVPLWDAALGQNFSACFCYTTSPLLPLAQEPDVNFVMAFTNSIMMEIAHIKTVIADQQKSDFIGSISHELRSPLHGVLASAEFLAETECNSFQKNLIDTVESCGRTLLDTINHVLDFSRINAFEKSLRNSKGLRAGHGGRSSIKDKNQKPLPGLLSIFAHTNVAAIAEEVVDSVVSGRMYSDISSADITDISPGSSGGIVAPETGDSGQSLISDTGPKVVPVDVILDIQYGNYNFFTQPGALRRVIMNIFGNSLKYTEKGMIVIQLRLEDERDTPEAGERQHKKLLRIVVKDTGRGISPNYLRTRLFTPFAQENVLTQGTGLGLSIVKSIISMLGGSIRVSSVLGSGTEINIALPVTIEAEEAGSNSSTPTATLVQNDAISKVRALGTKKKIGLFGFDPKALAEAEMRKVLESYITEWFKLRYVPQWTTPEEIDIIIVDESKLSTLIHDHPSTASCSIIVLRNNLTRHSLPQPSIYPIEHLTKPLGPHKLAKAIHISVQKMALEKGSIAAPSPHDISINKPASELEVYEQSLITNHKAMMNLGLGAETTSSDPVPELNFNHCPPEMSPSTIAHGFAAGIPAITDQTITITTPSREVPSTVTPSPRNLRPRGLSTNGVGVAPTNRKPLILLVDDNAINLRLLQMFMKKCQYEDVDTAENGLLALQAAERKRYDVIFMDLSMPVMNGFESTRAIRKLERERHENTPQESYNPYFGAVEEQSNFALVIALTGLASSRDQVEASNSGINIFMTKPVSFKDVGAILADWQKHIDDAMKQLDNGGEVT